MNVKRLFCIIFLIFVLFSAISIASASDDMDNVTLSDTETQNHLNLADELSELSVSQDSFTALNNQVGSTPSGGTLTLNKDYVYSNGDTKTGIVINKDLTIDGKGHTLNGAGKASIFKIQGNYKVTLKNINFINAYGNNGPALQLSADNTVNIINSKFINNIALVNGGAIDISSSSKITSSITITNSLFENNKASNGGAISAKGTLLNVVDSKFNNNNASHDGGSLYLNVGAYVDRCSFVNDYAAHDGGALYLKSIVEDMRTLPSSIQNKYGVFNTRFMTCSAGNDGGSGYISANRGIVSNVTIVGCTAGNNAGAGYIDGDRGRLVDSTFIDNTAGKDAGAVMWTGMNGMIQGCQFIRNTAKFRNSGALYLQPEENVSVFDGISIVNRSTFINNSANFNGGAIYASGIFVVIHNSQFMGDKARDGAGIYLDVGASIEYCTLVGEYAKHNGGAIYLLASNADYNDADPMWRQLLLDNIGVRHSTIVNCSADYDGGAGYVAGNYGIVSNVTMIGNSAGHDGGAGYILGNHGRLYNSTMINNRAARDGGALMWAGDHGFVDNVTCMLNRAHGGSGSICVDGLNITILKSKFMMSNATLSGGAIYVYGDDVTIVDSLFDRCAANAYHGGAIYVSGKNVYIEDCNFTMNRVNVGMGCGGAINVEGNGTRIFNCNFDKCTAFEGGFVNIAGTGVIIENVSGMHSFAANGGAFYIKGDYARITNANFSNNNATTYAGAIYIEGNFANLKHIYLARNIAYNRDGGAIYIEGVNTTIINANLIQNKVLGATARGGAVYLQGDYTKIINSTFNMCTAYEGGVVYVKGSYAVLDGYSCIKSLALNEGGAIYVAGDHASISNFNISLTNATNNGGAIYVSGDYLNINNSNFTMCTSHDHNGGAIYVLGLNTTITKSNFVMNKVNTKDGRGGSIAIRGNFTKILNSTFVRCTAYEGGVVYINGSYTLIDGYSCLMSFASNDGGAIYVAGDYASIADFDISLTNATNYGGAIYVAGNFADIHNSNFTRCVADKYNGGALYIAGLNATVSDSSFTQNKVNTKNGRGGSIEIHGINTKLINCDFKMCTAYEGGVVYINGSNAYIDGFTSNMTSVFNNGGALYIAGDDVTVNRFSIGYTNATNNGAAIYITGDKGVRILNGNLTTCIAVNGDGGAIYVGGYNTTIDNCNFDKTRALNGYGGAIFLEGDLASVENSNFMRSFAYNGGIIYIKGHDSSLINDNLTYSWAVNAGGSIYIEGDAILIKDTLFAFTNASSSTNEYAGFGGAIYIEGHDVNITSSVFFKNIAEKGGSGGAIFIYGENVNIEHSNFTYCAAPDYMYADGGASSAGAIAIGGNNATINGCDFEYSNARNGGVMFVAGSNTKVINSTISKSFADYDGGALYIFGEYTNISGTTFDHVMSDRHGGAVYIRLGEYTNIECSNFTFCNSTYGGAIDVDGNDVKISDSNMIDCYGVEDGGAIYISGNNVSMINSNFTRCFVKNDNGGAIYWIGSIGLVNNSNFINNTAPRLGGAIFMKENSKITFDNSRFINNTAGINGGAIDFNRGAHDEIILNSVFENNLANRSAGAVFWFGTNGTIKNSNFTNNRALGIVNYTDSYGNVTYGGYGGAVMWTGAQGVVDNCTFINNYAQYNEATKSGGRGGAVYLQGSDVGNGHDTAFFNSLFINNTAGYNGGAVDWFRGAANGRVENSTFINNTAHRSGGGIYWSGVNGTIKNSTFLNNSALGTLTDANGGGDGGAVLWVGPKGTIDTVNFNNNHAAYSGGAIYLKGSDNGTDTHCDDVFVKKGIFENNFAGLNGGALNFQKGAIDGVLTSSTFKNNTALRNGGALFWYGHNGTVDGCNFTQNNALGLVEYDARGVHKYIDENGNPVLGGSGGAIAWIGDMGNVDNSNFINNTAQRLGGAIFLRDNSYTVFENDSFINNTAGINGGAIDFNRGAHDGAIINSVFENNLANRSAGAVFWFGTNGTIRDSTFINNSALGIVEYKDSYGNLTYGGYGGAVMWTGAEGLVDNCTFDKNNAAKRGGAVYLQGSDVGNCTDTTFNQCKFDNNFAGTNGGAVDWHEGASNGNIYSSTFENNAANANGGAVYWRGHNGKILDSNFINNTALGDHPGAYGNVGDGGAMFWAGLNGLVENCRFVDNEAVNNPKYNASGRGGAVYIEPCAHGNKNTTFKHVYFENNLAGTNGGAINWHDDAIEGLVDNATFINNTAKRSGGAIFWNGYDGEIRYSKFYGNKALGITNATSVRGDITNGGDGGAVMWSGAEGKVSHCNFVNNTAAKRGGAVLLQGNDNYPSFDIVFADNYFDSNVAGTNGGAIDWYRGARNGAVDNSIFVNNTAKRAGGAIYWSGVNGTVKNSNFIQNSALGTITDANGGGDGGAILWVGQNGKIEDSSFNNNYAAFSGGAIFLKGNDDTFAGHCDNVTVTNGIFENNVAGLNGGAVTFQRGARNGKLSDSVFINNTAYRNAGAVFWYGTNGTIDNCSFSQNNALGLVDEDSRGFYTYFDSKGNKVLGGSGGAVAWTGDIGAIKNSKFTNNTAVRYGGAVFLRDNVNTTYDGSSFINNSANHGGAIYWISEAPVNLTNCILRGNIASKGSAIYLSHSMMEIINSVFLDNRADSLDLALNVTRSEDNHTIDIIATFRGNDNLLNAIWNDGQIALTNVTYWGINGVTNTGNERRIPVVLDGDVKPSDYDNIYQTQYEDYQNITVYLYDIKNNLIGVVSTHTNISGVAILSYTNNENNVKLYELVFHPEDNYYTELENSTSKGIVVIDIPTKDIYYLENESFVIKVADRDKKGIPTENVSVLLNGKEVGNFTLKDGCVDINLEGLQAGTYKVTVKYTGDEKFFPKQKTATFKVKKINSFIIPTVEDYALGEAGKIIIQVPKNENNTVTVVINGETYEVKVNESGYAVFDIPELGCGVYKVDLYYPETNNYLKSSNSTRFEIYPMVDLTITKSVNVTIAYVGDEIEYVIVVQNKGPSNATDVNVTEILSKYVSLTKAETEYGHYDETNGVWYIGNLDCDKTATLTLTVKIISANDIENTVSVNSTQKEFNDLDNSYSSEKVVVLKRDAPIAFKVSNITYGDDEEITIILPNNVTGTVNITVGNKNYNDLPVEDGQVKLTLSGLAAGNYDIDIAYSGDEIYMANSTSARFSIAKITSTIKLEVVDILEGEIEVINVSVNAPGTVKITVNGMTVEIPLDESIVVTDVLKASSAPKYDGKATWRLISLAKGSYDVYVEYSGNENYTSANASDIFHVRGYAENVIMNVDDIYVGQTAKIVVEFPKDATGNITVRIAGKTYTKALVNGKVTFEIHNLKSGKYDVDISYSGDDKYLPIDAKRTFKVLKVEPIVIKIRPHIDVYAPAIKVGENGKVIVTLPKDAKGRVSLEIDGKYYYASVKNGKAVFSIPNLKFGEYNIVIHYFGDDKYLEDYAFSTISVDLNDGGNNQAHKCFEHDSFETLEKYPTANPIFIVLLAILAIGSTQIRRFKK